MNYNFEWDEKKNKSNKNKHLIDFSEAITVFDDPFALIVEDINHSQIEKREWIIGESDIGVLVVVFTKRISKTNIRIISARKANKNERKNYEKSKRISF